MRSSEHRVTTLAAAQAWFPKATDADLPLTIETHVAPGGRMFARIYDRRMQLMGTRG